MVVLQLAPQQSVQWVSERVLLKAAYVVVDLKQSYMCKRARLRSQLRLLDSLGLCKRLDKDSRQVFGEAVDHKPQGVDGKCHTGMSLLVADQAEE